MAVPTWAGTKAPTGHGFAGGEESAEMSSHERAVVIGAGAMGTAIAQRLSQNYDVLLADLDVALAESQAARVRAAGGVATAAWCDVTDPQSVNGLALLVRQQGGLRVLTHVAGLSPAMGSFESIMRVNLLGPSLVTRALLPCADRGAVAILIASLGAHMVKPPPAVLDVLRHHAASPDIADRLRAVIGEDEATPNVAYQLSKFGLLMLCRRQAAQWAERRGRIVSLSPGMIATPMGALEFETNPVKQRMFALSPLKREGTLSEIANVVEFLVSDHASFLTGTDILVDGGLSGAISDVPYGGS